MGSCLLFKYCCQFLSVFRFEAVANGTHFISDAKDKSFSGGGDCKREWPHMASDGPKALLIDIIPKVFRSFCRILRMKISAHELVSVSYGTSQHSQIMQKGNADDHSLINMEPGFIDHVAYGKACSCCHDGVNSDR